jgi:hypothetical protein
MSGYNYTETENVSLCEALDRILNKGAVIVGEVVISVANIDLKLLHELLEKQALRRMESGDLRDDEIERLGVTLMQQAQEIEKMRKSFGLEEEDLNLDLGPLGKLL